MFFLQVSLLLGVATLYLGFAGVMGVLLHLARQAGSVTARRLAWLHGGLILAPASLFILRLQAWPTAMSWALLAAGGVVLWAAATQPRWTPASLWRPSFGHKYFASAMAFAALWGLILSWLQPNLIPAVIGASALAASFASLTKSPQPA
jgi:hypothetical protein